jgi:L-amino acid N-acyltransferase YncA
MHIASAYSPMAATLTLRPSTESDLPTITRIYSHHVRVGTASFEIEAPSLDEMSRRWREVRACGLPWLVADCAASSGQASVLGYAYASPFRPRPAYRFTLEDSIYVDETHCGRGIGRLLLAELLARCTASGARQLLAVIGDSRPASIALHAAMGFAPCGTLKAVGWKFGQWRDVSLMQRALGTGAALPPIDSTPAT